MPWPSGARASSCPSPAVPTGSWSAACPIRRRGAAACPARGDGAGRRPRRAPSAAGLRRAGRRAPAFRRDPSLLPEDVAAFGRLEAEFGLVDLGIALQVGEAEPRGLPEVVEEFHRAQAAL